MCIAPLCVEWNFETVGAGKKLTFYYLLGIRLAKVKTVKLKVHFILYCPEAFLLAMTIRLKLTG